MRKTHNDSTAPKNQKQLELADIFRLYGDDYRRSHAVSYQQLKVMHHIEICRTAEPLCWAVMLSNATNVHLSRSLIIHAAIDIALNAKR